ncbi:MAG: caspase family protein, partial [Myxococcota bacterium]
TMRPPAKRAPMLYVLAIGVSDYQDDDWELSYAAKDARDLIEMFRRNRGLYRGVQLRLLLDEDATRSAILGTRSFLQRAKADDGVVVFFAGRAQLDAKLNYTLATYDSERGAPQRGGLSLHALEGLLSGLETRRKVVLLNTTHFNETTSNRFQHRTSDSITVRGRSLARASDTNTLTPSDYTAVLGELFADFHQRRGAVVLASASGWEIGAESRAWNNSVFTHALFDGLQSRRADTNADGQVTAQELRTFVALRISSLTQGRQTLTSRHPRLPFDLPLH